MAQKSQRDKAASEAPKKNEQEKRKRQKNERKTVWLFLHQWWQKDIRRYERDTRWSRRLVVYYNGRSTGAAAGPFRPYPIEYLPAKRAGYTRLRTRLRLRKYRNDMRRGREEKQVKQMETGPGSWSCQLVTWIRFSSMGLVGNFKNVSRACFNIYFYFSFSYFFVL